jgi:hypothetical protein
MALTALLHVQQQAIYCFFDRTPGGLDDAATNDMMCVGPMDM